MKILTNKDPRMFRIGDKFNNSVVVEETPCPGRRYCESGYHNFEICGGFIYKLDPTINFCPRYTNDEGEYFCLFRVSDDMDKTLEKRIPQGV